MAQEAENGSDLQRLQKAVRDYHRLHHKPKAEWRTITPDLIEHLKTINQWPSLKLKL